ncbi:MAG: hypothetical protein P8Y67_14360 [Alphaproteobacteria bacterium]
MRQAMDALCARADIASPQRPSPRLRQNAVYGWRSGRNLTRAAKWGGSSPGPLVRRGKPPAT